MERAHPDALCTEAHQRIHPLAHFLRRLVRKCNGKDIPGIHASLIDQICDTVGQHPGLSRPRSCQDQKRTIRMQDRLPLGFIQCIINAHRSLLFSDKFLFIEHLSDAGNYHYQIPLTDCQPDFPNFFVIFYPFVLI